MAESIEHQSFRGRLYSTPNPPVDLPLGYFRPRTARPHLLRIAQYPSNTSLHRPSCPRKHGAPSLGRRRSARRSIVFGKLAGTRDSAKRFLRFVTDLATLEQAKTTTSPTEDRRRSSASLGRRPSASRAPSGETTAAPSATASSTDMVADTMGPGRPSSRSLPPGAGPPPSAPRLSQAGLAEELRDCDSPPPAPNRVTTFPLPENDKPVASGNGVSVSIALAEPMLFLQGFEAQDAIEPSTSMLRGSMHIRVTKSAKIKTVYLKFRGRAETDWPEGVWNRLSPLN